MISANLSAIFYLVSGVLFVALRDYPLPKLQDKVIYLEFWEWLLR